MVTFTSFSNLLPDPANPITDSGDTSVTGSPGPGFSAVNFTSVTDTQVSRTVSGRGIQRDGGSQRWEFSLSYNPMFREEFDVVDSFLTMRNPRKDPFYVILPQYSQPKNPVFTSFLAGKTMVFADARVAGDNSILIDSNPYAVFPAYPRPGDMFTITDGNDFNHQKVYKVGRVETSQYNQAGAAAIATTQCRVHCTPPLQRSVSNGAVINFINPKFRVITKGDVQEHSLNTDNLYSFSLALEEIQP